MLVYARKRKTLKKDDDDDDDESEFDSKKRKKLKKDDDSDCVGDVETRRDSKPSGVRRQYDLRARKGNKEKVTPLPKFNKNYTKVTCMIYEPRMI